MSLRSTRTDREIWKDLSNIEFVNTRLIVELLLDIRQLLEMLNRK